MPLNISDQAERNNLNLLITGWSTLDVKLFKNNITPDANTVVGDFTAADYAGASTLNPTWSAAATDGTGRAYTLSSTLTFPAAGSGTQTVYGWYAVTAGGLYVFGRRFDASITVSTTVAVDPFVIKFTGRQEP